MRRYLSDRHATELRGDLRDLPPADTAKPDPVAGLHAHVLGPVDWCCKMLGELEARPGVEPRYTALQAAA
jgi:hypothetical protein